MLSRLAVPGDQNRCELAALGTPNTAVRIQPPLIKSPDIAGLNTYGSTRSERLDRLLGLFSTLDLIQFRKGKLNDDSGFVTLDGGDQVSLAHVGRC